MWQARSTEVTRMYQSKWMPGEVPYGADQTIYLIIDRLAERDIEIECADIEAIIADLMSGLVGDPRRVVAFNTLEHWSEDISRQIAWEIQSRCDIAGEPVPEHVRDFVEAHIAPTAKTDRERLAPSYSF
jgi:hypothetical protein